MGTRSRNGVRGARLTPDPIRRRPRRAGDNLRPTGRRGREQAIGPGYGPPTLAPRWRIPRCATTVSSSVALGWRWLGAVLAACKYADSWRYPRPTQAPTPAATRRSSSAAAASPAASTMPGTKNFNVAFTSVGLSSAPMLRGDRRDAPAGRQHRRLDHRIVGASWVVQGVASGLSSRSVRANNSGLLAVEKGGPTMKGLTARVREPALDRVCPSRNITKCSDLAASGPPSTARVPSARRWSRTTSHELRRARSRTQHHHRGLTQPRPALLADQIDATPAELADPSRSITRVRDRFALLTSFAKDLPSCSPRTST